MIFVVVDEVSFHLRWRHSAERLRYINDREVQVRENIHGHARDCKNRAKRHTQDNNHHTDRTSQRSAQQPHSYGPPCTLPCTTCRKGLRSPWAAETAAKFCQTARRASASSISDSTSKLCASETSTIVARPA